MPKDKGAAAQAAFTPGPYERTHGDFVYALGTDPEGRAVNRMFLTVHAGWADGKRTSHAESNATAALFQAAPDLYAALRAIVADFDNDNPRDDFGEMIDEARAALAKAEGRSDPKGPSAIPASPTSTDNKRDGNA